MDEGAINTNQEPETGVETPSEPETHTEPETSTETSTESKDTPEIHAKPKETPTPEPVTRPIPEPISKPAAPAKSEKPKASRAPIILALFFALLALGAGGFIFYDKVIAKTDNSQPAQTPAQPTSVDFSSISLNFNQEVLTETESDEYDGWLCYNTLNQNIFTDTVEDSTRTTINVSSTFVPGNSKCTNNDANPRNYTVSIRNTPAFYGEKVAAKDLNYSATFDKDVRMTYVGGMGHAVGYEVILFIFTDGTVQYIPVAKSAEAGKVIIKDLEEVSDVIMASQGGQLYMFEADGETGGYGAQTILLHRFDGGIYDLSNLIHDEL